MKSLLCVLAVACTLTAVPVAEGQSLADPRIDQIASEVSGFHLGVDCYTSFDTWRHDWDQDEKPHHIRRSLWCARSILRHALSNRLFDTACCAG
jgi:hypothetical protein